MIFYPSNVRDEQEECSLSSFSTYQTFSIQNSIMMKIQEGNVPTQNAAASWTAGILR